MFSFLEKRNKKSYRASPCGDASHRAIASRFESLRSVQRFALWCSLRSHFLFLYLYVAALKSCANKRSFVRRNETARSSQSRCSSLIRSVLSQHYVLWFLRNTIRFANSAELRSEVLRVIDLRCRCECTGLASLDLLIVIVARSLPKGESSPPEQAHSKLCASTAKLYEHHYVVRA